MRPPSAPADAAQRPARAGAGTPNGQPDGPPATPPVPRAPIGRRCGRPARRAGDWTRSTMAHLCSAYPFHADQGFGSAGVYVGVNVTGGMSGFYFDPFDFYRYDH